MRGAQLCPSEKSICANSSLLAYSAKHLKVMVIVTSLSLCNSTSLIQSSKPWHPTSFPLSEPINLRLLISKNGPKMRNSLHSRPTVLTVTEGSAGKSKEENDGEDNDSSVPSWAKPGSDEPPPWASDATQKDSSAIEVPYIVYLLASAVTAIAAIGSVFEYVNQRPVFGVVESDSVFYAPLLGFFTFAGIPTSVYPLFIWCHRIAAGTTF